ncbi:hypothetical protein ESCO_002527 [Escovopsis weberi]|uniref:Uncharacterized protein n=1 Tax=Escovopsis weberi TaxID=150374 RepID=A0A0M8MTA4_ESCWE|nr:hypothetical protein ESCO_002527 [Escovopsis weberi]
MAAARALSTMLRRPQALAAPLRATFLSRYYQPTSRCARREYSSKTKSSNPTSDFYKTFTRPVSKVLVLAIFTYQVAYWTWAKLESDEHCEEADVKENTQVLNREMHSYHSQT